MAELIVTRTELKALKKLPLRILVDDAEIGTVNNGETKSFEISEGSHEVKIGYKIGYGKSTKKYATKSIEVANQENVAITTQVTPPAILGNFIAASGAGLIGAGLAKGGIAILGVFLVIIGIIMSVRASKKTGGKLCKIL